MPNYCDNAILLYVPHSDKSMIKKLDKIVDGFNHGDAKVKGLLNTIFPMPKHQPDTSLPDFFLAKGGIGNDEQKKFGNRNWYDWSVQNWGTKWEFMMNDADVDHNYQPGLSKYTFYGDTAWSPCVAALMNSNYDFQIFYAECGVGFFGYADRKVGDISFESDVIDTDDYDTFLEYEDAWYKWLETTDLPKDFFEYFSLPNYFGGFEIDDKPNWLTGVK